MQFIFNCQQLYLARHTARQYPSSSTRYPAWAPPPPIRMVLPRLLRPARYARALIGRIVRVFDWQERNKIWKWLVPSVECNENGNPSARTQWAWQWGAGSANNCCQTVFHEKFAHCIGHLGVGVGGEVHGELRSLRSAAAALKLCHRRRRCRRRRRRARHAACCNACKQDLTIKF